MLGRARPCRFAGPPALCPRWLTFYTFGRKGCAPWSLVHSDAGVSTPETAEAGKTRGFKLLFVCSQERWQCSRVCGGHPGKALEPTSEVVLGRCGGRGGAGSGTTQQSSPAAGAGEQPFPAASIKEGPQPCRQSRCVHLPAGHGAVCAWKGWGRGRPARNPPARRPSALKASPLLSRLGRRHPRRRPGLRGGEEPRGVPGLRRPLLPQLPGERPPPRLPAPPPPKPAGAVGGRSSPARAASGPLFLSAEGHPAGGGDRVWGLSARCSPTATRGPRAVAVVCAPCRAARVPA